MSATLCASHSICVSHSLCLTQDLKICSHADSLRFSLCLTVTVSYWHYHRIRVSLSLLSPCLTAIIISYCDCHCSAIRTIQTLLPLLLQSDVKQVAVMTSRLASISEVPVDGLGISTNAASRVGQVCVCPYYLSLRSTLCHCICASTCVCYNLCLCYNLLCVCVLHTASLCYTVSLCLYVSVCHALSASSSAASWPFCAPL